MALASPVFLVALVLIAVPIVLHRMTRGASSRVVLPTYAFLARVSAQRTRLFRNRHRLLLVLRCAALGFLALAFARPELPAPMAEPTTGRRGASVIVLDASLSMAASEDGVTAFERGRALALRVLQEADPQTQASVVLAGAVPCVLGTSSGDRSDLAGRLRKAQPAPERCSSRAALAVANDLLRRTDGAGTLTIVSDFQRTDWADADLAALPSETRVLYLPSAGPVRENAAVTAVRVRPEPPRPGETAAIDVDVWNGSGSVRTIGVHVSIDGTMVGSANVHADAWSSATATVSFVCPSSAPFVVTASIPHDDLPTDDARYLVVDPDRSLHVGIVTGLPDAPGSGAFYLARALQPDRQVAGAADVVRLGPRPTTLALARCDAVVVTGRIPWSADLAQRLTAYARNGGALVVAPADASDVDGMAMLDRASGGHALPCVPLQVLDVRRHGQGYVAISEARLESPVLQVFRDRAGVDLARVCARVYFAMTEPTDDAETLLRYEDSTPALVRHSCGRGQTVLWNLPLQPDRCDLVRRGVFVPLLHELLRAVCSRSAGTSTYVCGSPATVALPKRAASVVVRSPSGATVPATVDMQARAVTVSPIKEPGVYTVVAEGGGVTRFAADPPAEESDLRSIDPGVLGAPRGGRSVTVSRTAGVRVEDLRDPTELWPWMLAFMLACLLAEEWVRGWRASAQPSVGRTR